jgi:hypothetical protein
MASENKHDWVDTVSKLLIPIVIFIVGLMFSIQKDKNDRANQQFDRESSILKLAASPNQTEKALGLKIIEIRQKQGKFSPELLPIVRAISQGRPTDASTQAAQNILETAAKQNPEMEKQIAATLVTHSPRVFLQITTEDQRPDASDLQALLQNASFPVEEVELVNPGTNNNYVRYFSLNDKSQADKVVEIMKGMGFDVEEQNFTRLNQGGNSTGSVEVWIGKGQAPLSKH